MNLAQLFYDLSDQALTNWLILDCETDGLSSYRGHRPFLVTLMCGAVGPYSLDISPDLVTHLNHLLRKVIGVVGHNVIFDCHMLESVGVDFYGVKLWDTATMERLRMNDEMSYSLEACGERIGVKKDTTMKEFLDKNKLYTMRKGKKSYHFDKAPRDMVRKYADQDVVVTSALFNLQRQTFREWDASSRYPIYDLVRLEVETTPVLFEMERHGVKLDVEYCGRAYHSEEESAREAAKSIQELIKQPFTDSAKFLTPVFQARGLKYGVTEKGNPSFTSDVLEPLRGSDPLIDLILKHRESKKRGETYFSAFLELLGQDGRIHPSIVQYGAANGRLSSRSPNLQNLSVDDGATYPVRRAFVADPKCKILSLDYQAMELRMAADLAGDHKLIGMIKKGVDMHQAAADLAGVPRSIAKNTRFALLYGAGSAKIASMLKTDAATVEKAINGINETSPGVKFFSEQVIRQARSMPFLVNMFNRRFVFKDKRFSFKAFNYVISGTCADVMRRAMVSCSKLLRDKRTRMFMTIHDELLFSLFDEEHDLIPHLKDAMISAYSPSNGLRMEVSAALGDNMHDLVELTA